mmetsp:Transcript_25728/g.26125  ORF Transcript_25728/g.26125 Transcript_25728/m.26125 type:complete len:138 (-) Transcript_25728:109-522(-)
MSVCTKQQKGDRSSPEEEEETPRKGKRGMPNPKSSKQRKLDDEFTRSEKVKDGNLRFCGDLTRLKRHVRTAKHSIKHLHICQACDGSADPMCTICVVYLHFNLEKGKDVVKNCCHDYHDDAFLDLQGAILTSAKLKN